MSDFRKIEAFCKVCEQRSFSKAGEALFLSQPTVSAHIQSLERDLEVRLLDRMGRTVLPTPAGTILYRHAKQAFASLEAAKTEISALTMEVAGDLRIGSSSIPAHHVLPGILSEFIDRHPKVRLNLMVDSSASLTRQVLEGGLMAAIVGGCPSDPDIVARPLLDSEIVVIAPRDMENLPLSAAQNGDLPEIGFADACRLPWIFREYDSTTRKAFEEVLRLAGHDARLIRPRLVVDSAHAAIQYVRAGLGVSASARVAVQDALDRDEVRAFTIAGIRPLRRFSCITNTRRAMFPAAAVFLEFLLAKTAAMRWDGQSGNGDDSLFAEDGPK
jgi:DNA-binding transcriptional LysR family regulator